MKNQWLREWTLALVLGGGLVPGIAWGGIIVTEGKVEDDEDPDPCTAALVDDEGEEGGGSDSSKLPAGSKAPDKDPCGLTELDTTPPDWSCVTLMYGLELCMPPELPVDPAGTTPPVPPDPASPVGPAAGKADGADEAAEPAPSPTAGGSETVTSGGTPGAGCRGGGAESGWLGLVAALYFLARARRMRRV